MFTVNWWKFSFFKNMFTPFPQGPWEHHIHCLWKVWAYLDFGISDSAVFTKKNSTWVLSACILNKGPVKSTPDTNIFQFKLANHKISCTLLNLHGKERTNQVREGEKAARKEGRNGRRERGKQGNIFFEPLHYFRLSMYEINKQN